jgi:hypothetical protein
MNQVTIDTTPIHIIRMFFCVPKRVHKKQSVPLAL